MKQRRLPRRELSEIRAQFIRMIEEGLPADAIKAALKLSRTTYFQWKRAYEKRGAEGLKVRPIPGGTPKLTDQQTSQLFGWLAGRDPRQFQFDFALWTRKIVRELILQKFGVEMTPQGIGKLLRRIGLSPQRPLYRAYQQDPEAVRRWKEEDFPAIRERARAEGAELYFCDEAGVRTDFHAGTTWAPVGQTPVVEVTGERGGVNMISAISPAGALKFDVFVGRFDATVFVEFLTKLMHDAPGPVYLILDNLSVHKAEAVKKYVASLNGRLKLFFLPSYSPELNPDEWVWKNVKHDQVGRVGIQRKSELFELVTRALERLQRLPDIVRGFFRDPSLAYIEM
jgi:transposase